MVLKNIVDMILNALKGPKNAYKVPSVHYSNYT